VVVDRSTFGDTSAANQFSDSAMASGSGSRVGSSRQQQFSLPHTATRTPESTVQPHPAQRTCTNPIISARTVNLPPFGTCPTAVGDRWGVRIGGGTKALSDWRLSPWLGPSR
jgi:hypothetical protein